MLARWVRIASVGVIVVATRHASGDSFKLAADPVIAKIQQLEKSGQYAQALPLAEQLLDQRKTQRPSNPADVADALELVGELDFYLNDYVKSRDLHQRALAIRESVFGPNHLSVADSLDSTAVACRNLGEYERARPLYERALKIRQAALGPTNPAVAVTLNNLGLFYRTLGEYEQARLFYERALAIWEKSLGPKDPLVASALHNLGGLYRIMGALDRAQSAIERSLAIREEVLGPQHPNVAWSLNTLAGIYEDKGEYDKAQPLYVRALALRERALGPNHLEVAVSLKNLAAINEKMGQLDQARPLLERSLKVREQLLGSNHPGVAVALKNLGMLELAYGHHDEGRRYLARARRILESALGSFHPDVADCLEKIAESYAAEQRPEAVPLFERVFAITERLLRRDRLGADEARLEDFFVAEQGRSDEIYSLVLQYPHDARVRRLALATALLRKGRLLSEAKLLARTIRTSLKTPADQDQLTRLLALRRRMAGLELQAVKQTDKGPEDAGSAVRRAREAAEKIEAEAETLEDALARKSAPLRMQRKLPEPPAVIESVARALPAGAALVELVLFHPYRFAEGPFVKPSSQHYLGLVLGSDGEVGAVDVGDAAVIEDAAVSLRAALDKPGSPPDATRALAHLLMSKLGPLIAERKELYISPDGELNLVPFAALDDGKGALIDRYRLIYLTSGLDLLPEPKQPATEVVVLADPDFYAPLSPAPSATRSAEPEPQPDPETDVDPPARQFVAGTRSGTTRWHRLLGTRREAEAIHQILPQASLLLGREATKAALLRLSAPGILHIATHGWFLDDPDAKVTAKGSGSVANVPRNPLLRSAVVLAGANSGAAATTGVEEDGLVTALEMAQMDLWGTQLVVLSACDTGRGLVKRGQGVYGLRRALRIAGAETLVMSLWKVDDESTRRLRMRFYEKLMLGEGRAEAMRQAMREVRAEHADPNYWAPFFVLGRGEPLRSIHPAGH
jgi:CHAT domain-containing protein/Tfp pilus assembly protein PilF